MSHSNMIILLKLMFRIIQCLMINIIQLCTLCGTEPVDVSAPAAKDFAAIFNKVIAASEKAKIMMKSQADKHCSIAPIYKIGDQVWLSTDNLRMLNRASKKLMEKWIGPYIRGALKNRYTLIQLVNLCKPDMYCSSMTIM